MLPIWATVCGKPASFAAAASPAANRSVSDSSRGYGIRPLEHVERGDPARHGERIARKRAGLIDGSDRRDRVA